MIACHFILSPVLSIVMFAVAVFVFRLSGILKSASVRCIGNQDHAAIHPTNELTNTDRLDYAATRRKAWPSFVDHMLTHSL